MRRFLVSPFDFERTEARELAFAVLMVTAVLSPNISMPGSLPAVRLEQIILAGYLPILGLHYLRHRELWRFGYVDAAFAALAGATAITLALAPAFLEAVSWSIRDPFELARVAEYWFLFRLALAVEPRQALRDSFVILPALAVLLGIFAFVQYVDPGRFNDDITSIWTASHNLDGVERGGRTVGTLANANYFGAFSGLLVITTLVLVALRPPQRWWYAAIAVAVLSATFSVVSSQSRTATFALLLALAGGLVLAAIKQRRQAAYVPAIGMFLVAAAVSITFVEVRPPDVGSFSARFAPAGLVDDSSLTIRLSRWKSIFAGFLQSSPSFCEGERLEHRKITKGHEVASETGLPEAGEMAMDRDVERKNDVGDIGRAVLDYYCDEDEWPVGLPLDEALVPKYLGALPADPSTGEAYPAYVAKSGFLVGAELENGADPEGPIYALGTIPNIASNPSFETGEPPVRWGVTGPGDVVRNDDPLFGEHAATLTVDPGGGYYDTVVFDFTRDEDYTTAIWVRPVGDAAVTLQLYLAATFADGSSGDGFAKHTFTVEPGHWTQLALPFRTPEDKRITILQVILRVPDEESAATFMVDGATLTQGTFAPGFPRIQDTDPSRLKNDELPRFADSPVIGAGPRKDIQLGTVDNEYALFLDRYGLLGTVAYLALFAGAFLMAWRAWWGGTGVIAVGALVMVMYTGLLALFNVTAGSYYHFQIMAVYWLLIGALAAATNYGWRFGGSDA